MESRFSYLFFQGAARIELFFQIKVACEQAQLLFKGMVN